MTAFCDQCQGPYTNSKWLMSQYSGHWDTCPNRHNIKESNMTTYQTKTRSVEAQRFDLERVDEIAKWCNGAKVKSQADGYWIVLGKHTAVPGDYIAKLHDGSYIAYSPAQFEDQYDVVGHTVGREYLLARDASAEVSGLGGAEVQDTLNQPIPGGQGYMIPENKAPSEVLEIIKDLGDPLQYTDYSRKQIMEKLDRTLKRLSQIQDGYVTDGYQVEMDGVWFTSRQWEVIQTYAAGLTAPAEEGHKAQHQVREFQTAMGQPVAFRPQPLPADRVAVRVELIREEFEDELIPALKAGDLVETVDACVDLLYVVYGLMVEIGVDAESAFDEVHRSNMSKLGADGRPIVAGPDDPDGVFEGRVKKGPNYFKPNLTLVLQNQGWNGEV